MRREQKTLSNSGYLPVILTVFLSLAILGVSVHAQVVNNVYTIPGNFSANLPVLLVAETTDLQEPTYVGWDIATDPHLGSFKKLSSTKWSCYFSTKDSTCGDIPFNQGGSGVKFDLDITAFSGKDSSPVKAFSVTPGDLDLVTVDHEIGKVNEGSVFITVAAKNAVVQGSPKYSIYRSEDLSLFDSGDLVKRTFTGDYQLNRTLPGGKYFIAFEFLSDKGSGGFADYVEIGGAGSSGSLDVDSVKDEKTLNLGETYSNDFSIKNPLNQDFGNLTAVVSSDIKDVVKIALERASIVSKGTLKYTIKAENIRTGYLINSFFELYSGTGAAKKLLNKIPINLKINLAGQAFGGSTPSLVLVNPIWSGEYLTSDEIKTDITIRNGGGGELQVSGIEAKEGLTSSVVKAEPVTEKITTGEAKLTVKLQTASPETYSGKITVKSNGGEKDIFVKIKVYSNLQSDLADVKAAFNTGKEDLKKKYSDDVVNGLVSSIDLNIQTAENAINNKQYSQADESLGKAKAQLLILARLPEPPAGMSPLIIVVVIIVVVVAIVIYKKKIFSKKKPTEEEKYYEDEEPEEEK